MPFPPRVYRVELTPAAARALRKLTAEVRRRIARRIDALATQPRAADTTKIEGDEDLFRVRVGDYRIIYTINDDVLLVLVVRIGHRSDIYKAILRGRKPAALRLTLSGMDYPVPISADPKRDVDQLSRPLSEYASL